MYALRPDPEAIFGLLHGHARKCARCFPVRERLWEVRQLCPTGRQLVEAYSVAEVLADQDRRIADLAEAS